MSKEREALKLALEALEFIPESGSMLGSQAETKRLQAITAMREALAEQPAAGEECMRPNLITRLKEEWNNLDPVDPLRGLIADAIDALAEAQPSKPLTDEVLQKHWPKVWPAQGSFVRASADDLREFAHGITGEQK